jgi:aspartate carbamoyltransferase catalytic subunit
MRSQNHKITGSLDHKNIISVEQFDKKDIKNIFQTADEMRKLVEKSGGDESLKGKIMTALFYEPSSRTFGSFITAMQRLGGGIIPIHGVGSTSVKKGESLEDTIRTFGCYSEIIVLRHPNEDSVHKAAKVSYVPIINAGNGGEEHPTQTLLDLYTIYRKFNRLNNLKGVLAGDPLHSRTIKSLLKALALYSNNKVRILSPTNLRISRKLYTDLTNKGLKISEIDGEKDISNDADFWYWNRIQKERLAEGSKSGSKFVVTTKLLEKYGNDKMIIMNPLPRIDEIAPEVDSDPRSVYLKNQMQNGLYIRMALLKLILT